MLEHVPATVRTRGRIWTTERQRRECDLDGDGHGTPVSVGLVVVDRSPSWGSAGKSATFEQTLGVDGVIRVPKPVRTYLDLGVGDDVRLTLTRLD